MEEFFGNLERLAADLYPYRWPIAVAFLAIVAGALTFAYRRGWHLVLIKHRVATAVIGIPALAIFAFVAWDLGSPLFIDKTVEEEFPFSYTADVPKEMEREDVEKVMAAMAMVETEPMDEGMMPVMEVEMAEEVTERVMEKMVEAVADTMGTEIVGAMSDMMEAEMAEVAEEVMADMMEAQSGPVKLRIGEFMDQDALHKGSGTATIYRTGDGSLLLRLENLDVTNGPDLRVLLATHPDPDRRKDLEERGYVHLGKLKGNKGNQNYPIEDANVDPETVGSVVIYCMPFHVVFSVATLGDAG